ncbi:MAG: hypothetical protein WA655_21915 [Candidatus Korobacteraceae bacterium]
MRRFFLLPLLASTCMLTNLLLQAQSAEDALHAPDGNAREMIVSIFISPLAGAPFQANLDTEWTKHLPDGSSKTVRNHRLIIRDAQGRIYQERRTLVPDGGTQESRVFRIEISSPINHTKYFCDPSLSRCELRDYNVPVSEAVQPVGAFDNGKRYLSRARLGTKTMFGVEVIGTRETVTLGEGTAGNTAPIDFTKEFWYSPKLGINLEVSRFDPLHGDQIFTVSSLSLGEPDARLFVLPSSTKVVDMREKTAQASTAASTH